MENKEFEDIQEVFERPLLELVTKAHSIHRERFKADEIQASSLLSIKTGGCPENCSYCPQSAHYSTGVEKTKLLNKETVVSAALAARALGASRFCMGAAWRNVKDGSEFDEVLELVKAVKHLGFEVCCTLGMLNQMQATRLKEAGLYAYNHNIDTSRNFYTKIIQTRTYEDRLKTIDNVRSAGLTVCTGGILGMGESSEDRVAFIHQLASFKPLPESITINTLVPFGGTPLANQDSLSPLEIVRMVATLRIVAPSSMIRLSAGRLSLSEEAQFLCFMAGVNSIFIGDKLLTSPNPQAVQDQDLLRKLGYSLKKATN
ncbi:MAG TPA: biotin synthase BioB [Pseudobdellovibrionaceae bacterium]|jgi:biotin synthase